MTDIVVGRGEVGTAVLKVLKEQHETYGYDPASTTNEDTKELTHKEYEYMHICFPYSTGFADFFEEYIITFDPEVIVIHSTVPIGTTSMLSVGFEKIIYSPVRGIHPDLYAHLKKFIKYIAHPHDRKLLDRVGDHFRKCGLVTKQVMDYDQLEYMKMLSTTYYGLLISWAQQVQMFCWGNDWDYGAVTQFYKEHRDVYEGERGLKPVLYGTEEIGGHCIMANLPLLEESFRPPHIKAIKIGNEQLKQYLKHCKKD